MTSDLNSYCTLVDFLGKVLGPRYEVALHNLQQKENALIAIANGHISGRKIGSPLTKETLRMLEEKVYEKHDCIYDYEGRIDNGIVLRSSSLFIKDENGNPIGMLCINSDEQNNDELFAQLKDIIARIENSGWGHAPKKESATPKRSETFPSDISSLMNAIYDEAASEIEAPIGRLNQSEKLHLVSKLKAQGLFQLKGAVSFTAEKLSCSNASIYRYLGELDR